MLKIESGIPLPRQTKRGEYKRLTLLMKPGDSILFPERKQAENFRAQAYKLLPGAQFTQHRYEDGSVRVWLISTSTSGGSSVSST